MPVRWEHVGVLWLYVALKVCQRVYFVCVHHCRDAKGLVPEITRRFLEDTMQMRLGAPNSKTVLETEVKKHGCPQEG
jgi:hypothetical protein